MSADAWAARTRFRVYGCSGDAGGFCEGSVRVLPLGVVYTYRNDKVFMLQHSQELSGSGFRCRILGVYGLGF